jgi:hypothetical protein
MHEINLYKYTQSAERMRGSEDDPQNGDVGAKLSRYHGSGTRDRAGPAGRGSATAPVPQDGLAATWFFWAMPGAGALPHNGCAGPCVISQTANTSPYGKRSSPLARD